MKSSASFGCAQGKRGFTLVELLVVISIIAILSVIGITVFSSAQKSARDAGRRMDLNAIAKALEQYKVVNNTYSVATTFPCKSGTWWDFSDTRYGVFGTQAAGCPTSIGKGLAGYFSGNIPQDPKCKGQTSCDPLSTRTWYDYLIVEPNDGSSFTIYARLETVPTPPCSGAPSPYNYCVKSQQ